MVNIALNASVFKQVVVIFWGVIPCLVIAITITGSSTNGHWTLIPSDITINHAGTC